MSKRAAIYTRVSTDEQGKGYSLPTQLKECQQYAEEQGYMVVGEFSDDYTGTSMDRPALNKLRDLIERHGADVVVCYEIDRLSRKVVHQLLIEEDFARSQVIVEYVIGRYEATPEGQLMKQIRATVAEYERAKILERTQRGKRGRVQAGYVLTGAMPPFGYRYVRDPDGHKGWLEVDEEEADIVRQMFKWAVAGDDTGKRLGTIAIARKLSIMQIPTRRDRVGYGKSVKRPGVWGKSSVYNILTNEVYTGVWHYQKSRRTSATTIIARPRDEWIATNVPAIISQGLFDAAQAQLKRNKAEASRATRHEYLLRGRIVCETCGHKLTALSRNHPSGRHSYYRCGGQEMQYSPDYSSPKTCTHSLRQDVVDAAVWIRLREFLKDPEMVLKGLRQQQTQIQAELEVLREEALRAQRAVANVDAQRSRLLDAFVANPNMPQELLAKKMDELGNQREQAVQELQRVTRRLTAKAPEPQQLESVYAYCSQISQRLDNCTFEDKWETLEDLKVHGVLKRGPTPEMDNIELIGVLPKLSVPLGSKSVSCSHDVPMYWDQAKVKVEAEGTLVLEPR